MKKLMIAAAIVCAAAISQAAVVNWSTAYLNGSNGEDIDENPGYTYTISVVVGGVDSGTTYNSGKYKGTVTGLSEGTEYSASILVSEYKGGVLNATLSGNGVFTTAVSASFETDLNFSNGDGFTSGTFIGTGDGKWVSSSVPEPTSGLLMLLGVAGLALRRRRA